MIRVLLVDDSKLMVRMLQTTIEGMGFEVVAVGHDGKEGLKHFVHHRPDVTLLDVTMPNMSGVECLTRIKEFDADAHVVMLSAIQEEGTVSKCLELGATCFLNKPIKINEPEGVKRLRDAILAASGIEA